MSRKRIENENWFARHLLRVNIFSSNTLCLSQRCESSWLRCTRARARCREREIKRKTEKKKKMRLVVPHIGGSKNNQTRRRNGSRYSEVNGQREGASLNMWMVCERRDCGIVRITIRLETFLRRRKQTGWKVSVCTR